MSLTTIPCTSSIGNYECGLIEYAFEHQFGDIKLCAAKYRCDNSLGVGSITKQQIIDHLCHVHDIEYPDETTLAPTSAPSTNSGTCEARISRKESYTLSFTSGSESLLGDVLRGINITGPFDASSHIKTTARDQFRDNIPARSPATLTGPSPISWADTIADEDDLPFAIQEVPSRPARQQQSHPRVEELDEPRRKPFNKSKQNRPNNSAKPPSQEKPAEYRREVPYSIRCAEEIAKGHIKLDELQKELDAAEEPTYCRAFVKLAAPIVEKIEGTYSVRCWTTCNRLPANRGNRYCEVHYNPNRK